MKRTLLLLAPLLFYRCSDGDLQIENIDFEDGSVEFCDLQFDQTDTERTLFFKISDDEALILELESNLIANATTTETLTSSLNGESTLTYRLFSATITEAYFCSDVPPATPSVLEETAATDGTLNLNTTVSAVSTTTKTFSHTITIADLTLTNNSGERITDESGLDYGTYETTTSSSVSGSFTSYADIDSQNCDSSVDTVELYKVLNDEYISLTLPVSLLASAVTSEPRTAVLASTASATEASFSNHVLSTLVDSASLCAGTVDSASIVNSFTTTSGTVSVTTTENASSTATNPIFDHAITLTGFVLEDINGNSSSEITSLSWGTVSTLAN